MYATPKDRALAALHEFQRIMPTLTGYARAFTHNPSMRVIPAVGEPRTDGKAIYYQPPLKLADKIKHVKNKCNKWDDEGLQECPACMLRHDILFDMLHEIGHIVEGSLDPLTGRDKTWAVLAAVGELGDNPRTRSMGETIEKLTREMRDGWLDLAHTISPFLSTIVNAFEDARVNYKVGLARPGARRMRISQGIRLDREGVSSFHPVTGEPRTQHFIDMPLNHQMAVALYVRAVGDQITKGTYDNRVMSALADERIEALCGKALEDATPRDSYVSAIKAFVTLREYGFFIHESDAFEDPEPEPEPEPVEDDEDDFPSLNIDPQEGDDDDAEADEDDEGEGEEGEGESDSNEDEAAEPGEGEEDDSTQDGGDGGESGAEDGDGDLDSAGEGPVESDDSDELGEDSDDRDSSGSGDQSSGSSADEDDSDLEDGDEEYPEWAPETSSEPQSPSSQAPPSDDEAADSEFGEGDLGDDSTEPGEDDGESSSAPSDSESGDSSDVEDEFEGGGEGEADEEYSEDDSTPPDDSEQLPMSSSSDDGGADEGDAGEEPGGSQDDGESEDESSDGGEGEPGEESDADSVGSGDEGGGEGEAEGGTGDVNSEGEGTGESDGEGEGEGEGAAETGDGKELLSGTESLSEKDRVDGTGDAEEDGDDPTASQDEGKEPREWGDEQGASELLDHMLGHNHGHEDEPELEPEERAELDDAMAAAIMTSKHFDTMPKNIGALRLHKEGAHELLDNGVDMALAWTHAYDAFGTFYSQFSRKDLGIDCPPGESFRPAESIIGSTLLNARLAFTANRRSRSTHGLKSGKVDRRVLGKRAPFDDPRVFHKTNRPGKRDYFVLIGMDVSGSTRGEELRLEKKAVMAEAEVLSRLGIGFAVYAHSAKAHDITFTEMSMDMYEVKAPTEAWNEGTRHRLAELGPDGGNVDGHTLEFYRKILETRKETDLVLQYYTDGAMPAANFEEELVVMQRNIKICNDKGYTLMAVGIGTDSPRDHGFDTVRVDDVSDVSKVVQHLGRRLQA